MLSTISEKFNNLPAKFRAIIVGSTLSSIAVFLPWYSDVDAFNTGVTYLGITGPTSFIGISLLLLNVMTLSLIFFSVRFKRETSLPISRIFLEKSHGVMYLYAIALALSIYFHKDFGINVEYKTAGWGIYVGGLGALLSTYAGISLQDVGLAHEAPTFVEDVVAEDNTDKVKVWNEQQEIAHNIEKRQHTPLVESSLDEQRETEKEKLDAWKRQQQIAKNIDKKDGVLDSHIIRTDL